MHNETIYLDNHATTRCDRRVRAAMEPFLNEIFGNAGSSTHVFGWDAADAADLARDQVAHFAGSRPSEIVFTSGATESNNLALKGIAGAAISKGNIITQRTEHKSILESAASLGKDGWDVTILPVDEYGKIDPTDVDRAIRSDTALVSIQSANNEVGTIQPIKDISDICRKKGVLFHSDAAQAAGKMPIDLIRGSNDLMSISGHKINAPKGIGALVVRQAIKPIKMRRLIDGGDQEFGLRAGTQPVFLYVGLGAACEIIRVEAEAEISRIQRQRDKLYGGIVTAFPNAVLNGHPVDRLPGNLNLSFPGIVIDRLMANLGHIAVSSVSACNSQSRQPSHVLLAMGVAPDVAKSTIRFGIDRFTTDEEIDRTIDAFAHAFKRLKAK